MLSEKYQKEGVYDMKRVLSLLLVGMFLLSLGAVPVLQGEYTIAKDIGSILWKYQAGGSFEGVAIATNGEYVVAGSGWPNDTVYVFDISGNLKWKYKTEGFVNTVAISKDGNYIVVGVAIDTNNDYLAEDGKLYVFDKSGHILWTYDPNYLISSVAFSKGYVIFASKGIIYEFDVKGNLKWKKTVAIYNLQLDVSDKYIVVGHSCWFYRGEQNYNILYLFTLDGNLKWKKIFKGDAINSVAISKSGDYIAVGTGLHWDSSGQWIPGQNGYRVYILNEKGDILWGYKPNGRVSAVDIASNANYIAVGSDKLYLFDKYNHLLWSYTPESWIAGISTTPDGKYVVAGTWGGQLYLFETYAGNIKQLPVDFVYTPDTPKVGDRVFFKASVPPELGSKDVEYVWNFGDGYIETSSSKVAHHTYSKAGDYKVTLTVKVRNDGNWNIVGRVSPKVIYVQSLSEQEQKIYDILTKIGQWFDKADSYLSNSDLGEIVSDMFSVYLSQENIVQGEHKEYLPRVPSPYLEEVKWISPRYKEFSENAPAPTITSSELRELLKYLHENVKITPVYVNDIALSKTANGEFSIKYPDKTVYIREVTSEKIPELGYVVVYKSQYVKVYVDNIQKTVTILSEPKLTFDKIANKVSSRVDLWFGTSCIMLFGKEVCPDVKSVFKGDFDVHAGGSVGITVLNKLGDLISGKISILSPVFKLVDKIMRLASDFGISLPTEGAMGIEGGLEFESLQMRKYYFRSWSSVQLEDMSGETSLKIGVRADNPDIGKAAATLPLNFGATLALTSTNIPVVNWLMYSAYVGMVSLIPGTDDLYVEASASRNLISKTLGNENLGSIGAGVNAEIGTSMKLVPVWDPRWDISIHGGVIGNIFAKSPDIPLSGVLNLNLYGEAELPILELEFGDPVEPHVPEIHATFLGDHTVGIQGSYNAMTLSFNITTDAPGNYSIMPLLVLDNAPVVALKDNIYLQEGSNIITLTVPGQYVYYTNYSGPFDVGLIINDENGSLVYANFSLGTTKSYNYTDFKHVDPKFNIEYKPIDKDSNGLYDKLVINITEKTGLKGITLAPVLTAPGWIVYLNSTNLTSSGNVVINLDSVYVRKLAGNFTLVFYVYNTTSKVYLGAYSEKVTVNPLSFESSYPTIQSIKPIVVNNTPALLVNVLVPHTSNLTLNIKYLVGGASYESGTRYEEVSQESKSLILPLDRNAFVMHNTTTAKISIVELSSNDLTVDSFVVNREFKFDIAPEARLLQLETLQINDTLLVSAYITGYRDVNATGIAVLTFGNDSVVSYKYVTLRTLVPVGVLMSFNFTLENLTDAIRKSNGMGQLSIALYDDSGSLLATQTVFVDVAYEKFLKKTREEGASTENSYANVMTLSYVWTTWFFRYYDEFNALYKNATSLAVDNETLQEAIKLHNNATKLIKDSWRTNDLDSIRQELWKSASLLVPKFWEIRKAYLLEKQAIQILKNAMKAS